MDLSNAQLLRVDVPAGVSTGGIPSFTAGAAIAVDCVQDDVKNSQRFTLGAVIGDATAVLYVERDELPAGVSIDRGYRVEVLLEVDPAAVTYDVLWVRRPTKDGVSHLEVFLRKAAA